MIALVFVHIGPALPPWLPSAVRQARRFHDGPLLVAADAAALADAPADFGALDVRAVPLEDLPRTAAHRHFRAINPLDTTFRDGFWTHTTERFFYLEALMRAESLGPVLHLEGDVLLYRAPEPLAPVLAAHYPGLGVPFDHDTQAVAGAFYAAGPEALKPFNTFVARVLERPGMALANDMLLLATYGRRYGPRALEALPTIGDDYPDPLVNRKGEAAEAPGRFSRHARAFGGLFDGNATGQYLTGVDPRNTDGRDTRGFINETAAFRADRYAFRWPVDAHGRRYPEAVGPTGDVWPLITLHVHSKALAPHLSCPALDAPAG